MLGVPVLTPKLSSYWLHLVTSVDMQVARPLIDGLRNDVVTHDHRIRELLPGDTIAVPRGGAQGPQRRVAERQSRWQDARFDRIERPQRRFRLAPGRPLFQDRQVFETASRPTSCGVRVEANFGGRGGYGAKAEILWRLRGIADRVLGGAGLRRGRPAGALADGDAVDWWRVERIEPGTRSVPRRRDARARRGPPGTRGRADRPRRPPRADGDAGEHPPRVGPRTGTPSRRSTTGCSASSAPT